MSASPTLATGPTGAAQQAPGRPGRAMAAEAPSAVPPATLPVAAAGIPAEVRALPQFVVWTWAYRDGRWRKPPLRADGLGDAASNDERTWATCEAALAAYQRRGLHGIGVAVASDDPFFFVDLDDCRDPRTGAVAPWAAQVLARFRHTYQEVSPRATGFKVLGRGTPPGDRHVYHVAGSRPGAKVEVFDAVKYTTLTGHRLPGAPAAVRNAQAALDGLYAELFPDEGAGDDSGSGPRGAPHDDRLLDRARQARTGAAFCRLFDAGALGDYGGDPRRGEAALLTMLAAWCGPDRARLDRLFRRSALMGERRDARPDGESRSYGDAVIDAALAALADVPSPTRDPSRSHHH